MKDRGVFFIRIKEFTFKPIFRKNGYIQKKIPYTKPLIQLRTARLSEKPTMVALLPYVQKTFNHISRISSRHSQDLQPPSYVKDYLGLKTVDV